MRTRRPPRPPSWSLQKEGLRPRRGDPDAETVEFFIEDQQVTRPGGQVRPSICRLSNLTGPPSGTRRPRFAGAGVLANMAANRPAARSYRPWNTGNTDYTDRK